MFERQFTWLPGRWRQRMFLCQLVKTFKIIQFKQSPLHSLNPPCQIFFCHINWKKEPFKKLTLSFLRPSHSPRSICGGEHRRVLLPILYPMALLPCLRLPCCESQRSKGRHQSHHLWQPLVVLHHQHLVTEQGTVQGLAFTNFRLEALHLFVLYHLGIESICNVFSELKHIPSFVAGSQSDHRVLNISFTKDSLLPCLSRWASAFWFMPKIF